MSKPANRSSNRPVLNVNLPNPVQYIVRNWDGEVCLITEDKGQADRWFAKIQKNYTDKFGA